MDVAEKQNKQQSELHAKLWSMANDLRGTMDASEFKNYISSLRRFLIYHPIKDSSKIMDTFTINDIQNFYKTLNDFPILKHDNWDEFIDTIPELPLEP